MNLLELDKGCLEMSLLETGKLPEPPNGMFWRIEGNEEADYFRLYLMETTYIWGLFKSKKIVESSSVIPYRDEFYRLEKSFIYEANNILKKYHNRKGRKEVVNKLMGGGDIR